MTQRSDGRALKCLLPIYFVRSSPWAARCTFREIGVRSSYFEKCYAYTTARIYYIYIYILIIIYGCKYTGMHVSGILGNGVLKIENESFSLSFISH